MILLRSLAVACLLLFAGLADARSVLPNPLASIERQSGGRLASP